MFGLRFIKSQPTTHLMQFRRGRLVREGAGLAFFYYAPTSVLVSVPVGSQDRPFMLELLTADFQSVTVQGQVSFRVADPRRIAALLDFSLTGDGRGNASDDPRRLGERVVLQAEVVVRQAVQAMDLRQVLRASATIARAAQARMSALAEVAALGLEILDLSILAIKPTPDMGRALEAEAREATLKAADDAIYSRRMAAVENERAVRESELDTEVTVEQKKRQIGEAQMDARAAVARRENELRIEQMAADVELEESRKSLVARQADNSRTLAEAEAHRVAAVMRALEQADARVVQALAASGMQPGQLIAQAFGGLAEKAQHIGQLNVSPDLLQSLLQAPAGGRGHGRG
ncbi:MAG: SPFH domain-containing protein [Aquabacterium sp.]|nr:MAG: SPFH domain-containing protein [Aquabacterium sp.]